MLGLTATGAGQISHQFTVLEDTTVTVEDNGPANNVAPPGSNPAIGFPADADAIADHIDGVTAAGLFLILALISLLIGAVGIANTTLVAVLERTEEIGLRSVSAVEMPSLAAIESAASPEGVPHRVLSRVTRELTLDTDVWAGLGSRQHSQTFNRVSATPPL